MKWLRQMVLILVWMTAAWPCAHSVLAETHHHDAPGATELCANDGHACECHDCEPIPCTDKLAETTKLNKTPTPAVTVSAPPDPILYSIERRCPPIRQPLRRSETLTALLTVQLLI